MPAKTKTGRTAIKQPTGSCKAGFRRGQSRKPGPSDRAHCVETRSKKGPRVMAKKSAPRKKKKKTPAHAPYKDGYLEEI